MTIIGLSPRMSFTAAMIRPGRLRKEHHRHKGNLHNPEMYVIQTGGSSSGLSHYQHLYKKTLSHTKKNLTRTKSCYAMLDLILKNVIVT